MHSSIHIIFVLIFKTCSRIGCIFYLILKIIIKILFYFYNIIFLLRKSFREQSNFMGHYFKIYSCMNKWYRKCEDNIK